ncbi:ankyrin repeat-containing protein [Fusarium circinatum]|uniref:Ankyrin repeat-containing protein n=1 Tax=Fusarium circinatum TaxID=48490 RepID=A0A8H5TVS3_FUSCI|nr:ankyrin repeat-containing protein [Fusarium circinatum]
MVAALITGAQGTTGRRTKARNKGKKLLYSFHRPKLEQMATKLHHINATLQLGLQSLGLSVSLLGSEKLATIQATSQTISSDLLVVRSEVSAISTPIQGIQSTVSQFETRFDGLENLLQQLLVQGSTINRTLQEITPAMNAAWGPLRFSHETKIERHTPGCPATEAIKEIDRSSKFALTYVGLRSLLNSAIQLSFSVRSGAGGWSLGPNFTYYPMVDSRTAPAFRMFGLLSHSKFYLSRGRTEYGSIENAEWWKELLPSVASSILSLFRAKKASPRAVDAFNQSLVHYVASIIRCDYGEVDVLQSRADYRQSSPLLDLLQYLLANKAPANDYCTYGRVSYPVPAACADLILQANVEDALAHQSRAQSPRRRRIPDGSGREIEASGIAVLLYFMSCSTQVARAYGCGPLGLAILSNNLEEVKRLVTNHPITLSERNLFGHTPLHLATDKPSILRVLVEAADKALLNQTDGSNYSTLELAVSLSALNCKGQKTQMCLRSEHVLDYNAFQVTQLLEKSGIQLPASLAIIGYKPFSGPVSVYEKLDSPEDADIFFRVGFRETWAWCDADMKLPDIPFFRGLPYLRWLANHGGISCQVPRSSSKDIFGFHCIFWALGDHIRDDWQRRCFTLYSQSESEDSSSVLAPCASIDEVAWLHEVHATVFAVDIEKNAVANVPLAAARCSDSY